MNALHPTLRVAPPRTNLSILDRLVSVYKLWTQYVQHFPKQSWYTLGGKIDALFLECIELTFTASYQPKDRKLLYLDKVTAKFDLLKFILRVSWETKALDTKKYIALSEPLAEIGKMIGGWTNRIKKETQTLARSQG